MNRMGLVDFWFYTNEEFPFVNGHMLLRGSNGSGKSVTMQSFIPLLLDGNKSSERLDSFGTRSRKLENYLIEEEGERNDRIGYLYLEFKREDSEIYKTIGMGLHARRNKPLDSWYFVIEDNKRIGSDIQLMENQLAITKQVLKNKIGEQLIDTQKEYMYRVNKALFNFPTLDEYRETINLLMQLRSPKLSNSLKPTIINEILSNSLQPLSEEDLRPMSEAISNMDEIKDQLDALKQSYASAKLIANVYEQYNYASLDKKINAYLREEQVKKGLEKDLKNSTILISQNNEELAKINIKYKELKLEQTLLNDEYASLVAKDLMQVVEEVERCKQQSTAYNLSLEATKKKEDEKENQYIELKNKVSKYQDTSDMKRKILLSTFNEMSLCNENLYFEEHLVIQNELMSHLELDYDFSYSKNKIKKELVQLQKGLNLYGEVNNETTLLNRVMNDKTEQENIIENKSQERERYEQHFAELLEHYQEQFLIWNQNNKFLTLNKQAMQYIFDQLSLYIEEESSYEAIITIIQKRYLESQQSLNNEEVKQRHLHSETRKVLNDKREELVSWEKMKEPMPLRDEFVIKSRQYLSERGISYKPLYTLIDFTDEVPSIIRDVFEEQLTRIGLLDALIVNDKNRDLVLSMPEGMADSFIFVHQDIEQLSVYFLHLQPNGDVDLHDLFTYLGVDSQEIKVENHQYKHGVINGIVSKQTKSLFIGQSAREAYRLSKIEKLEKEVARLMQVSNEEEEKIQSIVENQKILETEFASYPNKKDLYESKQNIAECDRQLSSLNNQLHRIEEKIREYQEKIILIKLRINEIATQLGISSNFEIFKMREELFKEYEQALISLESNHREYLSCTELLQTFISQKEDIQNDLDFSRAERIRMEDEIEKLEKLISQKEEQLKTVGYENVVKRIEEIKQRQNVIPDELGELDRQKGQLSNAIQSLQASLTEKQERLEQQEKVKTNAYECYLEEAKLQYILNDEKVYQDVSYAHQYVQERFTSAKSKETLGNELQTIFYNNRGALQEYGLNMHSLFTEQEEGLSRLDISARYKGERISFAILVGNLESDIERQKLLLEDSDRILIEDILINTISKKIRTYIQNSRQWVDTMNRYMNSMNTSSGLKLNLHWKSQKGESEEEMNSEQLVSLLEKDPKILKASDFKNLSIHFQSKIQKARKLAEQQDNHESFHQIMKGVMDYRAWFEFKIMYEKTGEKKRELTNNAFFAFSGGEKAMSMYVPLFSAVAAKFEGASKDAPTLIALDEAFAGVDEKNINNMFALISKFGFDYIMNSQVLWGDYPSVKALAIHELFRPENARFVTVISYVWNGSEKVMVHN